MLGITVPDAVLILGLPGAFLTLYLGWRAGARAKRDDIERTPASAPVPPMMLDSAIASRMASALEGILAAMKHHIEVIDRRSEEQRREDDRKVLMQILEELRRNRP
jgi:uncharacterized OsmC-like protein